MIWYCMTRRNWLVFQANSRASTWSSSVETGSQQSAGLHLCMKRPYEPKTTNLSSRSLVLMGPSIPLPWGNFSATFHPRALQRPTLPVPELICERSLRLGNIGTSTTASYMASEIPDLAASTSITQVRPYLLLSSATLMRQAISPCAKA